MRLCLALITALAISAGSASAADRYTCRMIEKVIESTDNGLATVASNNAAIQPASGIAIYAGQSLEFAAKFSAHDPLPGGVAAALVAMEEAASTALSIADAAPALLEHGLIIHAAMEQICPETKVPDLSRHAG